MAQFKLKHFIKAVVLTQTLLGGVAAAEVLPADEYAAPRAGEQHPAVFPSLEAGVDNSLPLEFKVNYDRWYGNSYWGGGYRYYENVRAPSLSFQSVNLVVNAKTRLFSTEYTAFEVSTGTWNPSDSSRSSRLNVIVANKEIFGDNKSSTEPFSTTEVGVNKTPFDKTIFSASHTYGLGPIGLKVRGEVKGRIGVNVMARAYRTSTTRSGATFTGTSFAEVYGVMSAGVDVWLASGGVRGTVNFVKVTAAKNAKSERFSNVIQYDTSLTGTLCTLDGNLVIWGKLFGFYGEKTILDWDGYCFSRNFGGPSGSITMGRTLPVIDPILVFQP